jgi:hypothetical protein
MTFNGRTSIDIVSRIRSTGIIRKTKYWTSGELNPNNKTDIYFLMSQVSSIICLSEYGLSSYQEFFAECFSKWQTTPDSMKNKSWELLNKFFLHIYPDLKDKFSGALTDGIKSELFEYIEGTRDESLIYNIDLKEKPQELTYRDLDYLYDSLGFEWWFGWCRKLR